MFVCVATGYGMEGALLRFWGGGLRLELSSVVVSFSWLCHEKEVCMIAYCVVVVLLCTAG